MSSFAFTPDRLEKFKALVAKYEVPASALLPTLYLAQEQNGHLTGPALEYVAKLLGMQPARVFEAATFYVMFKKKDMGKFCLQVCNNITCTLMGSEDLIQVIHDDLKLKPMQVTEDGVFSYMPVQCLGSCDTAPVVQVNEEYFENQDADKFRKLLSDLRSGEVKL